MSDGGEIYEFAHPPSRQTFSIGMARLPLRYLSLENSEVSTDDAVPATSDFVVDDEFEPLRLPSRLRATEVVQVLLSKIRPQ